MDSIEPGKLIQWQNPNLLETTQGLGLTGQRKSQEYEKAQLCKIKQEYNFDMYFQNKTYY